MGDQEVLLFKMRTCSGPSPGPKVIEAEVADHTGKAPGSCLLLRFSDWALFDSTRDRPAPHTQAG